MPLTEEDIVRGLLHRGTPPMSLPASMAAQVVARQCRRDRRGRIVSVAATGVALGTAAGVVALAPGHSAAPGHPVQITNPASPARPALTLTAAQAFSPTAAQFAAMPTGLAALRAALIAQWDAASKPAGGSTLQRPGKLRHVPVPVPKPVRVSEGDKVFQQASGLLWNPLIGPGLRAALFRVLAATPGVRVSPSARDLTGRPAVEISRTDTSGWSNHRSDGITYAMYESPVTGAVRETTVTYPPGSDIVTPQDPAGTVTDVNATVYLSVTRGSTVPPGPHGG